MRDKGDITKLPKWAQEYIRNLEQQAAQATTTLLALKEGSEPSPFYLDDFRSHSEGVFYLPKYSHVNFGTQHDHISLYEKDGMLYVKGTEAITILPSTSNTAYIKLERR